MSIRTFLTGAVVATMALGSTATWAQGYDKRGHAVVIEEGHHSGHRQHDRQHDRQHRHSHHNDWHHDKRSQRAHERFHRREERAERRQARQERRYHREQGHYRSLGRPYYYGARGPDFRRGSHLPASVRSHQYVVRDHRHHRLHAPPRGHHWVQVGADYVLVAIATGIIANIVLNH